MKKILICYGTRPEYIKIEPIILHDLSQFHDIKTLFTGQHKDIVQASVKPTYSLEMNACAPNRLNSIVANITGSYAFDQILSEGFTHVLVQGDTASAFACALAAFNKGIKVIHLEAGLRTGDKNHPFPEEAYRQCISRITDIHLCATYYNFRSLLKESVTEAEMHVVGNTVLDHLKDVSVSYNNDILITLHRRENHKFIPFWYNQIEDLAEQNPSLNFVFVVHPNPNSRCVFKRGLTNTSIIDPMSHKSFIDRISKCRFLISDSGGVQEEASFLKKRVIICRETTERPEALESFHYLCKKIGDLPKIFNNIVNDYKPEGECPFGDGKAAEKILQVL